MKALRKRKEPSWGSALPGGAALSGGVALPRGGIRGRLGEASLPTASDRRAAFSVLTLLAGLALGAVVARAAAPATNASAPAAAAVAPLPFQVGERLVYRVYWGVIPVGWSTVTSGWEPAATPGRSNIVIRIQTRTNKTVEKLYPVNDLLESVIDPATFLPRSFHKQLSEGNYRADETTTFDHAARQATWNAPMKKRVHTFPIQPDTRDVLSFMYFMRQRRFEPGKREHYTVMADEKLYDVYLNTLQYEEVDCEAYGRVRSLKMEPEAAFGGLFVRKGRMWLWVSADARCLCTQIAAKVPVASIHIALSDVSGPGDDFWIRRNEAHRKP